VHPSLHNQGISGPKKREIWLKIGRFPFERKYKAEKSEKRVLNY